MERNWQAAGGGNWPREGRSWCRSPQSRRPDFSREMEFLIHSIVCRMCPCTRRKPRAL